MLERVRALLGASKTSEDSHGEGTKSKYRRAPAFLRIRSSTWFIGLAVGFGGEHSFLPAQSLFAAPRLTCRTRFLVLVDLSSYSLAVPVIPFRLQALGYGDIGGKTGWLVSAYAGGLIVSSPVVAVVGAKYQNRQIPLFLGLLFMAGAVVLFMEAESYGMSRLLLARFRRYSD